MDSWFYDERICVYTIINHIWITYHKIPCQISKVATKTTKKNCRCGEPFLYFSPRCDIPGENLWRIFNVPTRSLWEPLKIFKILLKIFKDLSFSCKDLQGFCQIRLRSITCHFLVNNLHLITYSNRIIQPHWKKFTLNATDSELFTQLSHV